MLTRHLRRLIAFWAGAIAIALAVGSLSQNTSPSAAATNVTKLVSGRVFDSTGEPVAGARVEVKTFGFDGFTATTASDGSFAISLALPAVFWATGESAIYSVQVGISAPGQQGQGLVFSGPSRPLLGPLDVGAINLPPIVTHQVRVVDAEGAPVGQARLTRYSSDDLNDLIHSSGSTHEPEMPIRLIGSPSDLRTDLDGTASYMSPLYMEDVERTPGGIPRFDIRVYAAGGDGPDYYESLGATSGPVFRLAEYRVPGPPRRIARPVVQVNGLSAKVTWKAPEYTSRRHIEYVVSGSHGLTARVSRESDEISVEFRLERGKSYTFGVLARNEFGASRVSDPSVPVKVPALAPDRPGRIQFHKARRSVSLSWEASKANGAPVTGYLVNLGRGKDKSVGRTKRNASFKNLKPGRYTVRVIARSAAGNSKPSRSVSFRIR